MTHPTADGNSLRIYMPSAQADNYIECWATRWDEDNKINVVIETFLGSANRNLLFSHIIPGAYRELYNILGVPKFIDTTYQRQNTLWLEPQYGYGLSSLRCGKSVAVKSASDTFINENYFGVKLELVEL